MISGYRLGRLRLGLWADLAGHLAFSSYPRLSRVSR